MRLTRGIWCLEQRHVELALAVSEVARAHEAVADRGRVHEVQLAVAARPDEIDSGFWRAVLGYSAFDDDNGVDPLSHGSTVWMQELDEARSRRQPRLSVPLARRGVAPWRTTCRSTPTV